MCALSPCVIGYAEIGAALAAESSADNPYRVWIDEYAGDAYQQVARDAREFLDKLADETLTGKRYPRLLELFRQATRLEADFWEMGLNISD